MLEILAHSLCLKGLSMCPDLDGTVDLMISMAIYGVDMWSSTVATLRIMLVMDMYCSSLRQVAPGHADQFHGRMLGFCTAIGPWYDSLRPTS